MERRGALVSLIYKAVCVCMCLCLPCVCLCTRISVRCTGACVSFWRCVCVVPYVLVSPQGWLGDPCVLQWGGVGGGDGNREASKKPLVGDLSSRQLLQAAAIYHWVAVCDITVRQNGPHYIKKVH